MVAITAFSTSGYIITPSSQPHHYNYYIYIYTDMFTTTTTTSSCTCACISTSTLLLLLLLHVLQPEDSYAKQLHGNINKSTFNLFPTIPLLAICP